MAWLMHDDEVLASLDVARTRAQRRRGLRGTEKVERPILLAPCRSVHSVGMRVPIDVAFLDADCVVVDVVALRPWRVTSVRFGAVMAIEAEVGSVRRWGVSVGDQLVLQGVDLVPCRFGVRVR